MRIIDQKFTKIVLPNFDFRSQDIKIHDNLFFDMMKCFAKLHDLSELELSLIQCNCCDISELTDLIL